MKNTRFFLEYGSRKHRREADHINLGTHLGTVVAVDTSIPVRFGKYEGYVATYPEPDSPVSWGQIDYRHIQRMCRRISEITARKIHPQLFSRLDAEQEVCDECDLPLAARGKRPKPHQQCTCGQERFGIE